MARLLRPRSPVMESQRTKAISLILLAALTLFNVGVPVYLYLCPMMDYDNPVCAMSPAEANGPSLTSITPDCCAKYLVAERKTTPFLKSDVHQPDVERLQVAIPDIAEPTLPGSVVAVGLRTSSPRSVTSPPLHILHSTFLL